MGRWVVGLGVLLGVVSVSLALIPFSATVSVTDVATNTAMALTAQLKAAKSGVVQVVAGDPVYVQFNSTATVTGAPLPAGSVLTWDNFSVQTVSTICAGGQSATVIIRGLP